jgi:hypothetical protein
MSLVWGGTKMVKNRQVWLPAVVSVVDTVFGMCGKCLQYNFFEVLGFIKHLLLSML